MLDDHKPYLHQRWNEGCTNIQQLYREVKALGFCGSYGTVYAYLRPFKGKAAPPAVPHPAQGPSHHQLDPPPPRQPQCRRAAPLDGLGLLRGRGGVRRKSGCQRGITAGQTPS
jgi:hypothetical protein